MYINITHNDDNLSERLFQVSCGLYVRHDDVNSRIKDIFKFMFSCILNMLVIA